GRLDLAAGRRPEAAGLDLARAAELASPIGNGRAVGGLQWCQGHGDRANVQAAVGADAATGGAGLGRRGDATREAVTREPRRARRRACETIAHTALTRPGGRAAR